MNNEVIFKNGSQVQIYDNNMSKECVTCRMYMNIIQVHCIGINDIISSIMRDTDDDDDANDIDDDTADDNTNDTDDGEADDSTADDIDDGEADDSTADDTGDDSDYDRDDRGDVNDVDSDIRGGVVADDLCDHRSDDNYDARGDF